MHEGTKGARHPHNGESRLSVAVLPLCLLALLSMSAACAHGQAATIVELPPLDMPEAPPRIVEAVEPQQPAVVTLPDEPRTNLPRPATPAPRTTDAQRPSEPPKTEPVVTEPSPATQEPPKTPPPTTLQTTPTQREGEVERRVRNLVAQAMNDLNRVNYQALNVDARNQYDTAKRFAGQAEEALRARNLVFASNLADKAAALAAQLLGR
jgi:outer membrane biosynthesis protein TonB